MTLVLARALGLVTLQDLGRPGRMHEALPPGGALVRSALVSANRAASNPDDAVALEILGRIVVRAEADTLVATDVLHTGAPHLLRAGSELTLSSEPHRAAYLALRGGITAPLLLGGRGAHLSAGLGALLRTGARLASAALPPVSAQPLAAPVTGLIHLLPGPDLDAFTAAALAALTSAPYRILPASDRVGTRLAGPLLPRRPDYAEHSRPMVRGALEVPRDGAPIVLGPEHPTTGGYPIIAAIAHADLDRFFAIRIGGDVRFVVA